MHTYRQAHTHPLTHTLMHERTHRIKGKKENSSAALSDALVQLSVCVCFSSRDVEDVCDSTESHTSLLRPSSVQPDLWLLAKLPVSHQSQGQPWAHVPCFYSKELNPSRWTENEDCQIYT